MQHNSTTHSSDSHALNRISLNSSTNNASVQSVDGAEATNNPSNQNSTGVIPDPSSVQAQSINVESTKSSDPTMNQQYPNQNIEPNVKIDEIDEMLNKLEKFNIHKQCPQSSNVIPNKNVNQPLQSKTKSSVHRNPFRRQAENNSRQYDLRYNDDRRNVNPCFALNNLAPNRIQSPNIDRVRNDLNRINVRRSNNNPLSKANIYDVYSSVDEIDNLPLPPLRQNNNRQLNPPLLNQINGQYNNNGQLNRHQQFIPGVNQVNPSNSSVPQQDIWQHQTVIAMNHMRQINPNDDPAPQQNLWHQRRRGVPVNAWGIHFSGDGRGLQFHEFLSQIKVYRRAEGISSN